MTPDWNQAPEWAQWVAMDSDGLWHWFEREPRAGLGIWDGINCRSRECRIPGWESICLPRPTTENEQ